MIGDVVVAVVVPAHNEDGWLGEVLDTMPEFVDRVIVVDDGSRDGTAEQVVRRQAAGTGVSLTLLRHRQRRGVGAAIASGYREALRQGAAAIAVMAGDGQMHPDDLLDVVRPVAEGRAAYVKGNRLRHRLVRQRMPWSRRIGSWVLSVLTGVAAGVAVTDSQCGYTAISAQALAELDLDRLWPGFGYPNDLIGALARMGARMDEVEVRPVYRGQQSGLRPWHALTIGFVIARVAWRRMVRRRDSINAATETRPWPHGGWGCPTPVETRRVPD